MAIVGKDRAAVASIAGYLTAKYAVVEPATLPKNADPSKSRDYMRNEDFRLRRPQIKFGSFPITILTARSVQRSIDAIAHSQISVIVMSLLDEKYRMKEAAREALSLISCAYHMQHVKVLLVIYWDSNLKVTEWLASTFLDLKSMIAQEMKSLGLDFNMPIIPASCEYLKVAHNIDAKDEAFIAKYEKFPEIDAEFQPLLAHLADLDYAKTTKDILARQPLLKVVNKYSNALVVKLVQGTLADTDFVFILPPPSKKSEFLENKEAPMQI